MQRLIESVSLHDTETCRRTAKFGEQAPRTLLLPANLHVVSDFRCTLAKCDKRDFFTKPYEGGRRVLVCLKNFLDKGSYHVRGKPRAFKGPLGSAFVGADIGVTIEVLPVEGSERSGSD